MVTWPWVVGAIVAIGCWLNERRAGRELAFASAQRWIAHDRRITMNQRIGTIEDVAAIGVALASRFGAVAEATVVASPNPGQLRIELRGVPWDARLQHRWGHFRHAIEWARDEVTIGIDLELRIGGAP